MEVMLKGSTKIGDSPKKFDVPTAYFEDDTPLTITLTSLESTNMKSPQTFKSNLSLIRLPSEIKRSKMLLLLIALQSQQLLSGKMTLDVYKKT